MKYLKPFFFCIFLAVFVTAAHWAAIQLQPTEYIVENLSVKDSTSFEVYAFTNSLYSPGDTVLSSTGDTLIIVSEPIGNTVETETIFPRECWTCTISTRIEAIPSGSRDTTICGASEEQIRQIKQGLTDTLITYRQNDAGQPMEVKHYSEVACTRLKGLRP